MMGRTDNAPLLFNCEMSNPIIALTGVNTAIVLAGQHLRKFPPRLANLRQAKSDRCD